VLIDPNFANWLFLLKRLKRAGCKIDDLPPIDVVLLTHAHFDHFHRPTLRRLPHPKIGIMPRGVGDLAHNLGFSRIIELDHWESFGQGSWKVTFTPSKHWGARTLHDQHRGYGGFVLEHQGRKIYHAGDSAWFSGFKEIGKRLSPEIALLPIGAYYPDTFRRVHMGPDEAVKAFKALGAKWLVPMHYGTFKLSFEEHGRAAPLAPRDRRRTAPDEKYKNSGRRGAGGFFKALGSTSNRAVGLGSAPAPGAVGRALAPHSEASNLPTVWCFLARVRSARGRANHSRGGCAPRELNCMVTAGSAGQTGARAQNLFPSIPRLMGGKRERDRVPADINIRMMSGLLGEAGDLG